MFSFSVLDRVTCPKVSVNQDMQLRTSPDFRSPSLSSLNARITGICHHGCLAVLGFKPRALCTLCTLRTELKPQPLLMFS